MLSRRMLFVGLVRPSHGSPCAKPQTIDRWRESLVDFARAEQLMSEAKKLYVELVYEPEVTDDVEDHFLKAQSLAATDSDALIIQQMALDVVEKRLRSNCFES